VRRNPGRHRGVEREKTGRFHRSHERFMQAIQRILGAAHCKRT
jgi:hypothetical protein